MPDQVDGSAVLNLIRPDGTVVNIPAYVLGVTSMWCRSKPLDLSNPNQNLAGQVKHISGVRFDLETDSANTIPPGLKFRLGWSLDKENNQINWREYKPIDKLNAFIPYVIQGRYIYIEIQDTFPVVSWKLTKIEFYGKVLKGSLHK